MKKEKRTRFSELGKVNARVTDLLPGDYAGSSLKLTIPSLKKEFDRLKEKFDLGQYDEVGRDLNRFVASLDKHIKERNDSSGELYLLKGAAFRRLGELQEGDAAAEIFNQAVDAFAIGFTVAQKAREQDYAGDYGVVLTQLGRNGDAVKWLTLGAEHNSEDPAVYISLGTIEQTSHDLKNAKKHFRQAIELSPYNLQALLPLCNLLEDAESFEEASNYCLNALIATMQAGMFDLARSISDRLTEIDSDNPIGLSLRSDLLLQLNEVDESVEAIDRARVIAPDNPMVLYACSRAHHANGEFDTALACVTAGLTQEPDNAELWWQQASVFVSMDRIKEAHVSITKCLELDPTSLMGWTGQAELFALEERYDEALVSLDKAMELSAEDFGLVLQKARLLNANGQFDQATTSARELVERPGLSPYELYTVAVFFVEVDKWQEALEIIDKVLKADVEFVEALLLKGSILIELDTPQFALDAYERVLKIDDDNLDAIFGKLSALSVLKRWEEALTLVNSLLQALPVEHERTFEGLDVFVDALAMKGSILAALHRYDEALEAYDHITQKVANNWEALQAKVEILSLMKRWDEAAKAVELALKEGLDKPQLLWLKSQPLFDAGRYEEAATALQQAIDITPAAAYLYSLGIVRNAQNRLDDALNCFELAIAQDPADPSNWIQKASVLRILGRNEEAVLAADHALQLSPGDSTALVEKGIALASLGREREAIDAMKEAVEANPGDAEVRAFQGLTYQMLYRSEEAVASYRAALERDPDQVLSLSGLSGILQEKGELTQAMKLLERAVDLDPKDVQLLGAKAAIYSDAGEFEAAVRTLDDASAEISSDSWVLSAKGWALENLGRNRAPEAKQAYEAALSLKPEFPDDLWIRKGLASALRLLGDAEKSREQYEEVLNELDKRSDVVDAETLALRGWCLYQLGEFEAAVDSYMEALSLNDEMPATQLDFALAILCMGKYKVGVREFELALAAVQKYEAKKQCGLLSVALDDLAEAVEKMPKLDHVPEVKGVRAMLEGAFSQAKTAA